MSSSINGPRGSATTVADLTVGKAPPPEVRPKDPSEALADETAELEASVPQVDETVVRSMLRALGGGLGYALGDEDVPGHWRFTEPELEDLTPPLTRIVNRNAKLRRAVIRGDEMAVALALAGYVGRNVSDGYKARKGRGELEGEAPATEGDVRADGSGLAGGGLGWGPASGYGGGHDDPAGGGVG